MSGNNRGMAIGFIFLILMVLFLGGMSISHLMQGVQKQLEFADAHVRAQYIAESGMNYLLARYLSKPWEDRWFAAGPDGASAIDFGGGTYDYFIQDTPDRPFFADIWIRSIFKNTKRSFFWRVKYRQAVLSGLAQANPVNSSEMSQDNFPNSVTSAISLTQKIETLLDKRAENRGKADQMKATMQNTNSVDTIITEMGGAPPQKVRNDGFDDRGETLPPPPPPPKQHFVPEFKSSKLNKIDILGLGLQDFNTESYVAQEKKLETKFKEKHEKMKKYDGKGDEEGDEDEHHHWERHDKHH